jgi:NitT/TauT family transport system substrate-binding protein
MSVHQARPVSRRTFLGALSLGATAQYLGLVAGQAYAEPPPETTKLRLVQIPSICQAPQYVAEELLRSEGFADIHYLHKQGGKGIESALASGEADINLHYAAPILLRLDAGDPIVVLAGGHIGCFELVASERVRAIHDLKGKSVAVPELGDGTHAYLATMVAYSGLDPQKDITWVPHPSPEGMQLLAEGKIDALMATPPFAQELRAKHIGHVLINSSVDRPWSQYFCCTVNANRDFIRKHPIATKRALRAILKSADICSLDPERAARFIVDKGYTKRYDYALEVMKYLPYGKWREYNPEDTLRFYALRLNEIGMIKSNPQKLIAHGSDWRFLDELRRELKT